MKSTILLLLLIMAAQTSEAQLKSGYANVNGIKMYYEVHGSGYPIVLLHGGGSTINTSFGSILPQLAKSHQVIAVELQAHGRASDRNAPSSFEQDADDVAELIRQLEIDKADIFGFSNGGNTAMQIAIRHPKIVHKLILASTFFKRDAFAPEFWHGMDHSTFQDMPQIYKDAFLQVNNDTAALHRMYERDSHRMQTFKDWNESDIRGITAPVLVVVGDQDVVRAEHAVEMYRLLPHARLSVLPGTHGSYMGEAFARDPASKTPQLFVEMVDEFLGSK